MNFLEAYRSGKPFKRQGEKNWVVAETKGDYRTVRYVGQTPSVVEPFFHTLDLLAEDWEVYPEQTELTPQEFWTAVEEILKVDFPKFLNDLKTKLGVKA